MAPSHIQQLHILLLFIVKGYILESFSGQGHTQKAFLPPSEAKTTSERGGFVNPELHAGAGLLLNKDLNFENIGR